jgi:hypothetical protein
LVRKGERKTLLTIKAKVYASPQIEAILKDAMLCATKVYNGLLWYLRKECVRRKAKEMFLGKTSILF